MSSLNETVISIDDSKPANKKSVEKNNGEINILCLKLSGYSLLTQVLCCSAWVFICYLSYGYFLELIFKDPNVKPINLYVTLVQFIFTVVFSFTESVIRTRIKRRVPILMYGLLAMLTLGTMVFSNLALNYLNYPTQLIFKSCKLIPVMIGSIIIMKKQYAFLDYVAAIMMCIGMTMFTLADSETSPSFNFLGVIIICMALICDAIIGNVQEKAMKQYQASNNEVVFYSYAIASLYLIIITGFSGTLTKGYSFCAEAPVIIYCNIFLLSLSGYVGLQAVLTLVRICDATVAVTVTTMRKALSIVISFLFFSKPFVFTYLWSGMLVVFAIYLHSYSRKYPNYVPMPAMLCWHYIQAFYQSEYRYLSLKTKIYADTV